MANGEAINEVKERLAPWLPGAQIHGIPRDLLIWQGPRGVVRYLVQFKNHIPQQDIRVLAHQLERALAARPKAETATKLLLFAPYVPPKQAEFLRNHGIDYADEAGNTHLDAAGVLVHVEGKRPDPAKAVPGGITKAWVQVTLAGLLRPALFEGPYRDLALAAGVTQPTVGTCLHDLHRRGLLEARGRHRRLVGRAQLLPLWTQAYLNTLRPRLTERRFRMLKGIDPGQEVGRLAEVLKAHDIPCCLTGAAAALQMTHYYETDVVEVYAEPRLFTDTVARELKAQPTTGEANLLVIAPPIPGLATEHATGNPLPLAPALLAYAELRYLGTDQANEAAALLLPLIEGHSGTPA